MKKILKILALPALIGLAVAYYMYNKPAKTSVNLKPDFEISSNGLFTEFSENESESNTKYLDKVVKVTGKIREVQKDGEQVKLVLETDDVMFGVICEMDPAFIKPDQSFNKGSEISVKGFCTGMLMDVVIVRCVAI